MLNDVAMSQAATVEELRAVDPTIGRRALYGRTMNVGIAHLSATVNTLVFAYLGTALPLLVLFSIQVRGLGFPLNEEIVAVEVVRTLIGSIGIVLTVPITTAIAVRVLAPGVESGPSPDRGDGVAGPRRDGSVSVGGLVTSGSDCIVPGRELGAASARAATARLWLRRVSAAEGAGLAEWVRESGALADPVDDSPEVAPTAERGATSAEGPDPDPSSTLGL